MSAPNAEPAPDVASTEGPTPDARPLPERLWVYQGERFPLIAHGAFTALFTAASVGVLTAGAFRVDALVAGFVLAFTQFALLRIADEHKDFAADAAHRPERAVPRGLVSLPELRRVGGVAFGFQAAALVWAAAASGQVWPILVWAVAQAWFFAMTAEFGAKAVLAKSPVLTLVSHMAILPLIAAMAAAPASALAGQPLGLSVTGACFLLAVFGVGATLEVARKIKRPDDEREGVDTYSKLWGGANAVTLMGVLIFATAQAFIGVLMTLDAAPGWRAGALTVAALGTVIALGLSAMALQPAKGGEGNVRTEAAAIAFGQALMVAFILLGVGARALG